MHNLLHTIWLLNGAADNDAWGTWLLRPAYVAQPPKKHPFGASVSFGYSATTGGVSTHAIDSRDHIFYVDDLWRYAGHVSYNYLSAGTTVSADRLVIDTSVERFFSSAMTNFLLAAVRYDRNPFSGYAHYIVESLGAGHRIFHDTDMGLKVEGGVGMRQNYYVDGHYGDVPIVRVAFAFHWKVSRHSVLTERVGALAATSGTLFDSDTGISTPIAGALALKLSEIVNHYTSAPLGFPRTTTFSTINLVYHVS